MVNKVLTIAGSDSSGGAGIQTDLKTYSALGIYGMSAITSITAQNTMGVTKIEDISPECVYAQIEACLDDIGADCIKIGMLSSSEIIEVVGKALKKYDIKNVVIDPVMVATTGFMLLKDDAVEALKHLLSFASIVTPNKSEAEVLSGMEICGEDSAIDAAKKIRLYTDAAILIKSVEKGKDLLYLEDTYEFLESKWIETTNSHGTGCTLSSAIASYLAMGLDISDAVKKGKVFISEAIENALPFGHGSGPTNPLWKVWTNIESN